MHNDEILHKKYILTLLRGAKIKVKEGDNSEIVIPYRDNLGLISYHRWSQASIYINVQPRSNGKLGIIFNESADSSFMECDELSNPKAYKWLIKLVKIHLQSYQIRNEWRCKD